MSQPPPPGGPPRSPWWRQHSTQLLSISTILAVAGIVVSVVLGAAGILASEKIDKRSREANWRTAIVGHAKLPGVYIRGLDLDSLYAPEADLSGSTLRDSNLSHSTLSSARLDGADLQGSNFSYAALEGATFIGSNLNGANLRHARLANANLQDARLNDVDLSSADLYGTDLRRADLTHAQLGELDMRYSCWDSSTKWPRGYHPGFALCHNSASKLSPPLAMQYMINADVVAVNSTGQVSAAVERIERDHDIAMDRLIVRYANSGAVLLRNVVITIKLGGSNPQVRWKATKVVLHTGANPNYTYPAASAIQDGGTTVNVGIGSFPPGILGYLVISLEVSGPKSQRCGTPTLTSKSFATPEGYGAVYAETNTPYELRPC